MTSIAELGIRVDSTDAAQAGTDLDKLAAAGGRAEKAADRASASFRKQTDDLAGLLGEIDPTVKALGRLDELESRLAKQKKLGALDASTFSEYQSKIEQSRTNLARFDDSLTRTGNTAKQTANAMRGVPAQFTDIFVSLQGGQAPLTVLLQQGGQLKDMFGGIGPAARAMGGYILGLVNPFTVAAAAAGVLGLAYYKGSQEAVEFENALTLTGNAAGVSADALSNMASQVAVTVGTTGAAADLLTKLAGSGSIASGSFEDVATAALQMEKATGRAVEETIAEFVKIGKDPVAAAKELNNQYNFLTSSTYAQIVALKEQGDTIGAAKLLTDTYVDTIKNRSGEVTENLSIWERGWKSLKGEISATADAVKNIGRDDPLAKQIVAAQQRIAAAASALKADPDDTDNKQKLQESELELKFLTQQKNTLDAIAKARGLSAETEKNAMTAQDSLHASYLAGLDKEAKKKREIEELDRKRAAALKGENADVEKINREYEVSRKALNERFKPTAVRSSVNLTGSNDAQNQRAAIVSEYKNSQKELEAAQKAGIISQQSYLNQRTALIRAERDEVTSAFQSEITALEAAKGKTSTSAAQRIELDQKIADARTNMVKAQKAADSELKVLQIEESGRLDRQTASSKAYVDQLERQRQALSLSGGREVTSLGLGDREAGLQRDLDASRDKFNDERLNLLDRRKTAPDKYTQADYERDLASLETAEGKYRDTVLENYGKMSEAQGDWRKGATAGFKNYLESARDLSGQAKSLVTGAFGEMEDSLVNFAMTGKLSFADFTKSIIADMARIASRQASSALLNSLVGAATSYFTGSGTGNGLAAGSAGAVSSNLGASQAGYSGSYFPQADGGAWSRGVQMFSNGGAFTNSIVSKPTAFGMAGGGLGVMGEAGDEAIMPLTRTAGGQLGVRAISGGGNGAGNFYSFPVAVSVQTAGDGSATSTEDTTRLGKGIQQAAKAEAETAIARALQPGGSIWRLTNGRA